METPPKFLKFISLISENLFYSEDDIAVIEESDIKLSEIEISQDDIDRAISKLKNQIKGVGYI